MIGGRLSWDEGHDPGLPLARQRQRSRTCQDVHIVSTRHVIWQELPFLRVVGTTTAVLMYSNPFSIIIGSLHKKRKLAEAGREFRAQLSPDCGHCYRSALAYPDDFLLRCRACCAMPLTDSDLRAHERRRLRGLGSSARTVELQNIDRDRAESRGRVGASRGLTTFFCDPLLLSWDGGFWNTETRLQMGGGSLPASSGGQRQRLHREPRSRKTGPTMPGSGCLVMLRSTGNTSSFSTGWQTLPEEKPAKRLSERGRSRGGAAAQTVSKTPQAM